MGEKGWVSLVEGFGKWGVEIKSVLVRSIERIKGFYRMWELTCSPTVYVGKIPVQVSGVYQRWLRGGIVGGVQLDG